MATATAAAILAAGCGGPASDSGSAPGGASGTGPVYVAVGASDSIGAGLGDQALRLRDAWPQLFFNAALPGNATFVDLGIPGATTTQALEQELPGALALHPTVATVWLNVDDLIRGVTPQQYEAELGRLVHALRRGGETTVLVATTPVVDHLPAYLDCRPGGDGDRCAAGAGATLPPPEVIDAAVDAYDAAVARVAAREGAIVVDLHAQGDIPVVHPDWVSADGLHPSALGYAEVARLFVAAYRAAVTFQRSSQP